MLPTREDEAGGTVLLPVAFASAFADPRGRA